MNFGPEWVQAAQESAQSFAAAHGTRYHFNWANLAAAFEVGCFHAVLDFYRGPYQLLPMNLTHFGEYKYLTTTNGNPANFSYVRLENAEGSFDLRQQVRVQSTIDQWIAFTPDLVVVPSDCNIGEGRNEDYARGNRRFFFVRSSDVVAAHECKSTAPFPELLVSYLGMLLLAHSWFDPAEPLHSVCDTGEHLAPTLFIGGAGTLWQNRMIEALQENFPLNIVLGLHSSRLRWHLRTYKRIRLRGGA
jgi:hypothetical protein